MPVRRTALRRAAAAVVSIASVTLGSLTVPASAAVVPSCDALQIGVSSLGGPNFYIDSGSTPKFRSGYTGYRITNGSGQPLEDVYVSLSGFTGGSLGLAAGQSPVIRSGDLAGNQADSLFWYLTATAASATAQNHTVTLHRHDPALSISTPLCTATGGFAAVEPTISANANKVTGITVEGGTPRIGSTFTVEVTGDTGTIGQGIANDAQSLWMTPAVTETWPADSFRLVGTSLTIAPTDNAAQTTYTDILRVAGLGSSSRPYTARYTFQAVGFTSSPTPVKPVQEIASGTQVKHTGSYPAEIAAITPPQNDLTTAVSASPTRLDTGGGTAAYTATLAGTAGASVDSFVVTPPTGATVTGTATWGGRTTRDPVLRNGTLVFPGPFEVTSPASTLRFSLHHDGTPGPRKTSIVAALGSSYIGGQTSPLDGSNPAATAVSVNTAPVAPDVTTSAPPGTSVTVATGASDPDGDPLTVTSVGTPLSGTAEVVDGAVVYHPAGPATSDSFDYTVSDGRGGTATGTIHLDLRGEATPTEEVEPTPTEEVEPTPTEEDEPNPTDENEPGTSEPAPQGIAFELPEQLLAGPTPVALDATASSGLPVSFDVLTGDCRIEQHGNGPGGLVAERPTACTVQATQPGDGGHLPAVAQQTVTFVAPQDDQVAMGSPVTGAPDTLVDVLGNDPKGLILVAAAKARHGTVGVEDSAVRYAPDRPFRGTDTFDYTVEDEAGRTAAATVRVSVANTAPTVRGTARLHQLAGSTVSTRLTVGDANEDDLTVTATTLRPGVRVALEQGRLVIEAAPEVSGEVTVRVRVSDGAGGAATAEVVSTVRPRPATGAARSLSDEGTTVSWKGAATTGARYAVLVDGRRSCTTTGTSCMLGRVLGPKRDVEVVVLGREGTSSAPTGTELVGHHQVLMATVYFPSSRWDLTPDQTRRLARVASQIRALGFPDARVSGYTDSRGGAAYNLALSRKRTRTVSGYLRDHGPVRSRQAWFGYDDPVADNSSAAGRSRNRRVEILVAY